MKSLQGVRISHFAGSFFLGQEKKTLRNFRGILEKRLLRLGNEKGGLHKTQKRTREKRAAEKSLTIYEGNFKNT